jgi:hypothetical protein
VLENLFCDNHVEMFARKWLTTHGVIGKLRRPIAPETILALATSAADFQYVHAGAVLGANESVDFPIHDDAAPLNFIGLGPPADWDAVTRWYGGSQD